MHRTKSPRKRMRAESQSSGTHDAPPQPAQPRPQGFREWFRHFAHLAASAVGSPWAFAAAVAIILVWAASGPLFHYSDTWQLVINTSTTIVTFLMVFLIQNTQNRDARAMHLKLDELIRALHGARNRLVDLEELSDKELDDLEREFQRVRDSRDDAIAPDDQSEAAGPQ